MAIQTVFKRYELKYILTAGQKQRILSAMAPYMKPDEYGRTTIRNLYFDTDTYLLIRRSIDRPAYKEKLRIRSYGPVEDTSRVFVELKKKYESVVYKRRIALPYGEAADWLSGKQHTKKHTQISEEIDYFLSHYSTLRPRVFLSYQREAYYAIDDSGFRITFDDTILCRREKLSLNAQVSGVPVLPEGKVLMEIKCGGGIPLWLTRILSEEKLYKTSFSKYGEAYKQMIYPQLCGTYKEMTEVAGDA